MVESRLTRLEEHSAFAEHTTDQLSEEVAELLRRLDALAKRLQAIEAKLDARTAPAEADDAGDA